MSLSNVWHTVSDLLVPLHAMLAAHRAAAAAAAGGGDGDGNADGDDGSGAEPVLIAFYQKQAGYKVDAPRRDAHADTPLGALFLLTGGGPVYDKGGLERLDGRTCFETLYTGLDIGAQPIAYSFALWQAGLLVR